MKKILKFSLIFVLVCFLVITFIYLNKNPIPSTTIPTSISSEENTATVIAFEQTSSVYSQIISRANEVCNGEKVAEAGEYDPNDKKLHPTIVLDPWNTSEREDYTPDEWKPTSVDELELVICSTSNMPKAIESCHYSNSTGKEIGTLTLTASSYDTLIVNAKTSDIIKKLSTTPEKCSCPDSYLFSESEKFKEMSCPSGVGDIIEAVKIYVNP